MTREQQIKAAAEAYVQERGGKGMTTKRNEEMFKKIREYLEPNYRLGDANEQRKFEIAVRFLTQGWVLCDANPSPEVLKLAEAVEIILDDADFYLGDVRKLTKWPTLKQALTNFQRSMGEK